MHRAQHRQNMASRQPESLVPARLLAGGSKTAQTGSDHHQLCWWWSAGRRLLVRLPTTSGKTYALKITLGNETNIHVACRAGLDQNRIPPHRDTELGYCTGYTATVLYITVSRVSLERYSTCLVPRLLAIDCLRLYYWCKSGDPNYAVG